MYSGTDYRKSKRFEQRATIMIEDKRAKFIYYGQMLNYSAGGMCIGSDAIFERGTPIKITFDKPLYKSSPKNFHGTVKWCNELARDDFDYLYGTGLKFD
ncbi:MAG: PilZ domain-containing protein [Melioribacteraceae bacterium]|nr:PilZ domain-containing protein [Melioribacteraceae bacterium]